MAQLETGECLLIGGEPTLHPEFSHMVSQLRASSIRVVLFTNMMFEQEQIYEAVRGGGVNTIISSLDSHDPATHTRLRGRPDAFDRLVETLAAVRTGDYPFLALNTVVSSANYHPGFVPRVIERALTLKAGYLAFSLMDFVNDCRERRNQSKADRRLSPADFNCFLREFRDAKSEGLGLILASNPDLSYVADGHGRAYRWYKRGQYGMPLYATLPCWESWNGVNILPNGDVYPCLSTILTPRYRLGNILDRSLIEVVNDAPALRYRTGRLKHPWPVCVFCKDCQTKNVRLTRLAGIDGEMCRPEPLRIVGS